MLAGLLRPPLGSSGASLRPSLVLRPCSPCERVPRAAARTQVTVLLVASAWLTEDVRASESAEASRPGSSETSRPMGSQQPRGAVRGAEGREKMGNGRKTPPVACSQ